MNDNTEHQLNESGNNLPNPILDKIRRFGKWLLITLADIFKELGIEVVATMLMALASGVIAPIAVAATLATGAVLTIKAVFSPTITETRSVNFVGTFPQDKLFTSYAIVPVIYLDSIKTIKINDTVKTEKEIKADYQYRDGIPDKVTPTGYCKMQYQVAFGYDHVQELMSNETYKQAACSGRFDALPQPDILSKSRSKLDSKGSFQHASCDNVESQKRENGTSVIDEYIVGALAVQTESLDSLIEKSQKALGAFIRINCPTQNI